MKNMNAIKTLEDAIKAAKAAGYVLEAEFGQKILDAAHRNGNDFSDACMEAAELLEDMIL